MRVTKTIREFIEKEVSSRLAPKYEAEKREAERQCDAIELFRVGCATAAEDAFRDYFNKHFSDIADFAEDNRGNHSPRFYFSSAVGIRDRCYINNVHHWKDRKNKEVKQIVNNIIVELELGGTKAELMKMLDEVGQV